MKKGKRKKNRKSKKNWKTETCTSCKISKKSNEPILSNNTKKFIFGPKINKNGENRQNENFPKNRI